MATKGFSVAKGINDLKRPDKSPLSMMARAIFDHVVKLYTAGADLDVNLADIQSELNLSEDEAASALRDLVEDGHLDVDVDMVIRGGEFTIIGLKVHAKAQENLASLMKESKKSKTRGKSGEDESDPIAGVIYRATVTTGKGDQVTLNIWTRPQEPLSPEQAAEHHFIRDMVMTDLETAWAYFDDLLKGLADPDIRDILTWAKSLPAEQSTLTLPSDGSGARTVRIDAESFSSLIDYLKEHDILMVPGVPEGEQDEHPGSRVPAGQQVFDKAMADGQVVVDQFVFCADGKRRYPWLDAPEPIQTDGKIDGQSEDGPVDDFPDVYSKSIQLEDETEIELTFVKNATKNCHRLTLKGKINESGEYIKLVNFKDLKDLSPDLVDEFARVVGMTIKARYEKTLTK